MHEKDILGKKILVVTAHPDDESFLAAGTIYRNHLAGGKTALICATFGEKGRSNLKKPMTEKKLKQLRKKEMRAAARFLKINRVVFFNLPDGDVKKYESKMFRGTLEEAKKFQPQVILSFGPDGISGHWDHITVGKAAKKAAQDLNVSLAAFALAPRVAAGAHTWLFKRRKNPHYTSHFSFQKPNLEVPISKAVKIKALKLHASQMEDGRVFAGFPVYASKAFCSREYFVISDSFGQRKS